MTFSTVSLSSFEEFYAEWHPRAVRAARKRGLRDPEAVASDIMLVFFEKGYLEKHDPTMKGAVTFESWVNSILYNRLNNAYRDESRKPSTVEIMDHDDIAEVETVLEFKLIAMSAFDLLTRRYGDELAAVWVSIVKQVVDDSVGRSGNAIYSIIQTHLGLGAEEVSSRMTELRHVIVTDIELREMLGADSWAHKAA